MLPILMVQDVVSLWWYRRDWDGWNLKVMLPGAVVGTGSPGRSAPWCRTTWCG